jgi:heme exporter protein C
VSSARKTQDLVFYVLFAATAASFVYDIQLIFFRTPVEMTMGIVQKIFYFHVPAAYAMYLAAGACFVGSVAYLYSPTDGRDALAKAGAEIAVVFGLMVMISGPLWGAKAWGRYWTWDPRLTTTMLTVLIYVAYVLLRSFAGDGEAEKKFAAALGIVGGPMLYIIHISVKKWGGQHPVVIGSGGQGIAKSMLPALFVSLAAFTLLAAVLVWMRMRIEIARARLHQLEEEAASILPEGST